MIPAHLMKLYNILTLMVKESRITRTDRNSMLAKAGLHYLGASKWQDENSRIYTLGD